MFFGVMSEVTDAINPMFRFLKFIRAKNTYEIVTMVILWEILAGIYFLGD